jgi:hypothetical protein
LKIGCECGGVIIDQTDYLPYKAHLISDQDWFDFLDAIDEVVEKSGPTNRDKENVLMCVRSLAAKLAKSIYQCTSCGRLYVQNLRHEFEVFEKPFKFEGRSILGSAYGDGWKRTLIGSWEEGRDGLIKGYLWEEENNKSFQQWEHLENQYLSRFEELKGRKVLRSALLKRNGDVIHCWDMHDEE